MKIVPRLFIYLTISFILATIIGTLTHELGHFAVANFLGYEAHFNYAHSWWEKSHPNELISDLDSFLITLGGPLVTIFIGTFGFIALLLSRKSFKNMHDLLVVQWMMIFASLFWLRQPANFLIWASQYFIKGTLPNQGDEIELAEYFELAPWMISFITAIFGAVVLMIVVTRFIPIQKRFTFLISGVLGGVVGYVLWLHLLGPILIP